MRAAVVGASGYIGGELVRLLDEHPHLTLSQATSDRLRGKPFAHAHPNLLGRGDRRFVAHDDVEPCDVLFLAVPPRRSAERISQWLDVAPLVVDLSPDFRLADLDAYVRYYGWEHPRPELLRTRAVGLPELHRKDLVGARLIAVPGCMATAATLALHPLAAEGLVSGEVTVCALTGSSGSGAEPGSASHHPERSGVMRVFKAIDHRHEAEIEEACGVRVRMTAVAVEAVRGMQAICSARTTTAIDDRTLWDVYRNHYGAEPFVRIVKRKTGIHRHPEPKLLAGTNFCDVGFAASADGMRVTVMGAADNLVKGAAGNAIQSVNVHQGWDERAGLAFAGLHPA
ncbi:MAG TPA: N-acetyl-gamma-glutamyl-phosphate reductase [Actinomycetota bacterium]|nr:N-acetyl-gamma-glutamyl-phosphate reductase [Actinomycetota bacterium]